MSKSDDLVSRAFKECIEIQEYKATKASLTLE